MKTYQKMKRVNLGDSVEPKFENEMEAADASIGLRIKDSVYNYIYEKAIGYIVEPMESIKNSIEIDMWELYLKSIR